MKRAINPVLFVSILFLAALATPAPAQDVTTGDSTAGGDAAANTDIDFTTTPASGLGVGNPSLGGNWVAGLSPEGRKNVTPRRNHRGGCRLDRDSRRQRGRHGRDPRHTQPDDGPVADRRNGHDHRQWRCRGALPRL